MISWLVWLNIHGYSGIRRGNVSVDIKQKGSNYRNKLSVAYGQSIQNIRYNPRFPFFYLFFQLVSVTRVINQQILFLNRYSFWFLSSLLLKL